jgi:hypothetical protein
MEFTPQVVPLSAMFRSLEVDQARRYALRPVNSLPQTSLRAWASQKLNYDALDTVVDHRRSMFLGHFVFRIWIA